jgi:hypothetical protein
MEKKFLVVGFAALLIIGFVAAGASRGFRERPDLEELGLSEDATPQEIQEALFQKRLSDLGLTEDSTIKELKEAVEANRRAMWEERLSKLKEKLGLLEDASEEDVKEALKEKRGECEKFRHERGFLGKRMMEFPGL